MPHNCHIKQNKKAAKPYKQTKWDAVASLQGGVNTYVWGC